MPNILQVTRRLIKERHRLSKTTEVGSGFKVWYMLKEDYDSDSNLGTYKSDGTISSSISTLVGYIISRMTDADQIQNLKIQRISKIKNTSECYVDEVSFKLEEVIKLYTVRSKQFYEFIESLANYLEVSAIKTFQNYTKRLQLYRIFQLSGLKLKYGDNELAKSIIFCIANIGCLDYHFQFMIAGNPYTRVSSTEVKELNELLNFVNNIDVIEDVKNADTNIKIKVYINNYRTKLYRILDFDIVRKHESVQKQAQLFISKTMKNIQKIEEAISRLEPQQVHHIRAEERTSAPETATRTPGVGSV